MYLFFDSAATFNTDQIGNMWRARDFEMRRQSFKKFCFARCFRSDRNTPTGAGKPSFRRGASAEVCALRSPERRDSPTSVYLFISHHCRTLSPVDNCTNPFLLLSQYSKHNLIWIESKVYGGTIFVFNWSPWTFNSSFISTQVYIHMYNYLLKKNSFIGLTVFEKCFKLI